MLRNKINLPKMSFYFFKDLLNDPRTSNVLHRACHRTEQSMSKKDKVIQVAKLCMARSVNFSSLISRRAAGKLKNLSCGFREIARLENVSVCTRLELLNVSARVL